MLSDKELWACAAWVEQHHGDRAPHFITERLMTLARDGDEGGVLAWKGISDRYDQLQARHRGPLPI